MTIPDPTQPGQPGEPRHQPAYPTGSAAAPAGAPGRYPAPGQYPAPGGRYGTLPYGVGGMGGEIPEPASYPRLLLLTLLSAAAWVLSSLPGLFGMDRIMAQVRPSLAAEGDLTAAEVDEIVRFVAAATVTSAAVMLLIGLGLYAAVYFGLRGVRGWARILGIVLAILGILSGLSGLTSFLLLPGALGVLATLGSVALVVVNVLWLIHAFRSDVAEYVRQGRRVAA